MDIAYLSTFYPYRGGIAQFNASLYREMEKNEHNVTAYTFRRQYPEILFPGKSQMVQSDDKADEIPAIRILDTVNPANYYSSAKKIVAGKHDVMLTKYWIPFFAPSLGYVGKAAKKAGVCNIAILDNVIPHESRIGDEKLTKYFLNQYYGFIVMSDTVKDDLLKLKPNANYEFQEHPLYNHFGEVKDKEEARKKLDVPQDKKIILFFGFIREYKGLDTLIKAMKLLDDDYYLIIAGESYEDFNKYAEKIVKLKIDDKVGIFHRYISDEEVPDFFSASDVCVLPYKSGTQSGIIGISYNFNLPVIATRVGSLAQMIEPYKTGMVIEDHQPETIKDAIIKYFDEELYLDYKTNIDSYRERHSWNSIVKAIERIYDKFESEKELEIYNNV